MYHRPLTSLSKLPTPIVPGDLWYVGQPVVTKPRPDGWRSISAVTNKDRVPSAHTGSMRLLVLLSMLLVGPISTTSEEECSMQP